MLVLSRKMNENIIIGEGPNKIIVRVIDITRGKVRLGIDAPKEVSVFREELLLKEGEENVEATSN